MKKSICRSRKKLAILLGFLVGFSLEVNTWAGVIGAGNTGDLSLQFEFARSSASSILREVSVRDLLRAEGEIELVKLYRQCRKPMFIGAMVTKFRLRESIPDGEGFHAFVRRLPDKTIEISRTQMDLLLAKNELDTTLLIAAILHEVGHDCIYNEKAVGDEFDASLNKLAYALIKASNASGMSQFRDINFMQRVQNGESVRLLDLPQRTRLILLNKYLDYVGDKLYLDNVSLFKFRPAPASQFDVSTSISMFDNWAYYLENKLNAQITETLQVIVQPSYSAQSFSAMVKGKLQNLHTELQCQIMEGLADCHLLIYWNKAKTELLSPQVYSLSFSSDIFGQVEVQKVGFIEGV